jgi:hypothetical protein
MTAISRRALCKVSYKQGGRELAVATIGRDLDSLKAERALEGS